MNHCSEYEKDLTKKKMKNSFYMAEYFPEIVKHHKNELMRFFDATNTDYLVKRKERIRNINSKEQTLDYINEIKVKFKSCIGEMPEKTEVCSEIVGTLDKGRYFVDKVLIESLPGYYLSANYYYPIKINGKAPGILFLLGHSSNGKGEKLYIEFCVEAVLNGFCVLTFDPLGQGLSVKLL